jgi:hypothetical protein
MKEGDVMMQTKGTAPPAAVFVLEIQGSAILAFKASTHRKAQELGKEGWLQEDLKHMTAGRAPLWDGKAPIKVRRAQPEEAVRYAEAKVENAAGDLPLVYLVQRDDEPDTSGPGPQGAFPPRR